MGILLVKTELIVLNLVCNKVLQFTLFTRIEGFITMLVRFSIIVRIEDRNLPIIVKEWW